MKRPIDAANVTMAIGVMLFVSGILGGAKDAWRIVAGIVLLAVGALWRWRTGPQGVPSGLKLNLS
jgi:hypothetical protein